MRRPVWLLAISILVCRVRPTMTAASADLEGLFPGGRDHPAIGYPTRRVQNTVSQLNVEIGQDLVHLQFDGVKGYLRSVLDALDVPIESQIVVFSKTSLMSPIISPGHPRSIFFNDRVAVAWVPGEPFIEVAAVDPRQGVVFYTLDQGPAYRPRFVRSDYCLVCHESYGSLGVPGMLVRSVFPAPTGLPVRTLGDYTTDDRSPWKERWGGWYVTGKHVTADHMGNATFADSGEPSGAAGTPESLAGKFDTSAYLTPYSDVVALMVFEHQAHLINLLTRVGWEVRYAMYEGRLRNTPLDQRLLLDTASEVVDYLLFVDEAPLAGPSSPDGSPGKVQGSSGFTARFEAAGPRDTKGRSLRQLDLDRRLMRYPCSYMIYSAAFDSLPDPAKAAIYRRMWQVLSGEEKGSRYARLTPDSRRAVVEILRETKPGLPDYFMPVVL